MSQFVWTFPGGKKTIQKSTAVAGNAATTKTVPTGKIWLLTNINITLTTDATVGGRYSKVNTQDADNDTIFENKAATQTASLGPTTKFFIYMLSTTNAIYNGLGHNILTAGEDVVLSISGGFVGDAYDYLVEYLEIDAP